MLSSRSLWVHKRISALGGRQGFVAVPADLASVYVAAGWASRVFNPWATRDAPDAPYVDTPELTVSSTPQAVTVASPAGTPAATVAATGGTAPYVYTLVNNDGGNFAISGDSINTTRTGLSEGAHSVTVFARDAGTSPKWSAVTTVAITVAAAPPGEDETEPQDEPLPEGAIAEFINIVDSIPEDAEVNTHVASIEVFGTEPYTYTWLDNDGGNFRRSATEIYTNATPLEVGAHTIAIRVTDADGAVTEIAAEIEVTDAE